MAASLITIIILLAGWRGGKAYFIITCYPCYNYKNNHYNESKHNKDWKSQTLYGYVINLKLKPMFKAELKFDETTPACRTWK